MKSGSETTRATADAGTKSAVPRGQATRQSSQDKNPFSMKRQNLRSGLIAITEFSIPSHQTCRKIQDEFYGF